MKISLKNYLMIQSLSPLALLTIIRYFLFRHHTDGEYQYGYEVTVSIIVIIICVVWILVALWAFIKFSAFMWTDKIQGYQLKSWEEKENAGLYFFMTIIIPVLIDDVSKTQGAVMFLIIVMFLFALLYRTKLYYANPILTILGYHIYEIQFKDNRDYEGKYIGIAKGELSNNVGSIEYKHITENVLYIKEMEK
jgi:hypothetical protein